jgi:hypothetical protein
MRSLTAQQIDGLPGSFIDTLSYSSLSEVVGQGFTAGQAAAFDRRVVDAVAGSTSMNLSRGWAASNGEALQQELVNERAADIQLMGYGAMASAGMAESAAVPANVRALAAAATEITSSTARYLAELRSSYTFVPMLGTGGIPIPLPIRRATRSVGQVTAGAPYVVVRKTATGSKMIGFNAEGQAIDPATGRFTVDPLNPPVDISRVKLRADVIDEILAKTKVTRDGKFYIDPNTKQRIPVSGPYDFGHKPGFEWWKTKERAIREGWSREQIIEYENDPKHYQVEAPGPNRSHRYEKD